MKKIIFFLALSTACFSQEKNKEKKTEETQESRVIKVYSPSNIPNNSASNAYKWTVKTDIFSFISGEFPIIAEYRFATKFSVEASAGVTYGFIDDLDIFDDLENDNFDKKAAMGSAFRGGIKFYPSSDYDAIEGWAFGIQLYTRTNNRTYTGENYFNEVVIEGLKASKSRTGASLTISKQVFLDSNIAFEYLFGIGFASVKDDFYEAVQTSQNGNTVYVIESRSVKETKPNIQLGLRIGFGN